MTIEQLAALLDPIMVRGSGEKFDEIRGVAAKEIRRFEVSDRRAVSLLDECVMDRNGNRHPAHAHIAICEAVKAAIHRDDDTFIAIQEGLKLLFEPGIHWQRTN
ncbi:MAG: hypothetical protein HXY30_19685 [Pseudorhodoplanes sp.]|nr:hypothetical protein [Pseudorhodoplanes sp.]